MNFTKRKQEEYCKSSIELPAANCRNRKEFTFTVMWVDFHWRNKNILYFSFKSIPLICSGGFPNEEGTFRTIYQFCPFYWHIVSTGHNLGNWIDWDIEQTDIVGAVHRERMQSQTYRHVCEKKCWYIFRPEHFSIAQLKNNVSLDYCCVYKLFNKKWILQEVTGLGSCTIRLQISKSYLLALSPRC